MKRIIPLLLLLFILTASSHGFTTNYWTNTVANSDWSTAGNWAGGVPTGVDVVTFTNDNTTFAITLSAPSYCSNMSIFSPQGMTAVITGTGQSLDISNSLSFTAATLARTNTVIFNGGTYYVESISDTASGVGNVSCSNATLTSADNLLLNNGSFNFINSTWNNTNGQFSFAARATATSMVNIVSSTLTSSNNTSLIGSAANSAGFATVSNSTLVFNSFTLYSSLGHTNSVGVLNLYDSTVTLLTLSALFIGQASNTTATINHYSGNFLVTNNNSAAFNIGNGDNANAIFNLYGGNVWGKNLTIAGVTNGNGRFYATNGNFTFGYAGNSRIGNQGNGYLILNGNSCTGDFTGLSQALNIGSSGNGYLIVSNGVLKCFNLYGGDGTNAGSRILLDGGITSATNTLILGNAPNSLTWMTNSGTSSLYVTNGPGSALFAIGLKGVATNDFKAGTITADKIFIGDSSSCMTMEGGNLTINSSMVVNTNAGSGSFIMSGGTNTMLGTSGIVVANSAGATGTMTVSGGYLLGTNVASVVTVGSAAGSIGSLTQSAGEIREGGVLTIGNNGQGTYSISGGTNYAIGGLVVGSAIGSTGTVVMTGGLLDSTGATSYLGNNSMNCAMLISNAAQYSGATFYLGNTAASSNNLLIVDGVSTKCANTNIVYIGFFGSSNSMIVTRSGAVTNKTGYIGYNAGANNNAVVINSSTWSNIGNLYVGVNGLYNSLTISNGGFVYDNDSSFVGSNNPASSNAVLVSSGVWSNKASVYMGYNGSYNSMIISNGGSVYVVASSYIGYGSSGTNNTVIVDGPSSMWANSVDLNIGYNGSLNTLAISRGAIVTNNNGYVGKASSSFSNIVSVAGSGSAWSNMAGLYVGNTGNWNTVVVSNSGMIFSGGNSIVGNVGSNNTAYLLGNSTWQSGGNVTINTANSLVVSNASNLIKAKSLIVRGSAKVSGSLTVSAP